MEYSADEGETWHLLGMGMTENRLDFDRQWLPGSSSALIRVFVSDGFYTSSDVSDAVLSLPEAAPTATITMPSDNSTSQPGSTVILNGRGFDPEDGLLDDNALRWSSDLSGDLGKGSSLMVRHLKEGRHRITLRATDSDGRADEAHIILNVGVKSYLPATFGR